MYMPDDGDIPQDDLEDLIDLEYEAEMDLMRELEQEAAEAALRSHQAEVDVLRGKEDRPPATQTQSQRQFSNEVRALFRLKNCFFQQFLMLLQSYKIVSQGIFSMCSLH